MAGTPEQIRFAITRFERCITKLEDFEPSGVWSGSDGPLCALQDSVRDALESAFGAGTVEFRRYEPACVLIFNPNALPDHVDHGGRLIQNYPSYVKHGCRRAIRLLKDATHWLNENLNELNESAAERALHAYEGLDLHPKIAEAASALYRNAHYANAIEDAVKALNSLVRFRSGSGLDGKDLMQTVFSPKKPILKFNALADQSDLNEQTGLMMMFTGVVVGIRNPRAHKLIQDDPKRALEFIAFISLLAKLADSATK